MKKEGCGDVSGFPQNKLVACSVALRSYKFNIVDMVGVAVSIRVGVGVGIDIGVGIGVGVGKPNLRPIPKSHPNSNTTQTYSLKK